MFKKSPYSTKLGSRAAEAPGILMFMGSIIRGGISVRVSRSESEAASEYGRKAMFHPPPVAPCWPATYSRPKPKAPRRHHWRGMQNRGSAAHEPSGCCCCVQGRLASAPAWRQLIRRQVEGKRTTQRRTEDVQINVVRCYGSCFGNDVDHQCPGYGSRPIQRG